MLHVEAEGLTKVHREGSVEVVAVQDVSLAVGAGELVAVIGPSGSGKTTLLSMLGGILRPTAGVVRICGERVWDLDERRLPLLRRKYFGFIFQSFNLFAALTAAQNIEVALNLKGINGGKAKSQVRNLLDAVGLAERERFLPRDLSGGEKQRVSIARALAGGPPVILADEPTANLDWKNGEQVMRLLRAAATSEGRSVIVVTHDHRIGPYIDRTLRIEDGRLLR